jgi:hypothetical protein
MAQIRRSHLYSDLGFQVKAEAALGFGVEGFGEDQAANEGLAVCFDEGAKGPRCYLKRKLN